MTLAYPVRQCAWCHRVADASGRYGAVAERKLMSATHGICPGCKELVRAEIDGTRTTAVAVAA
jgi:hypothetical protein